MSLLWKSPNHCVVIGEHSSFIEAVFLPEQTQCFILCASIRSRREMVDFKMVWRKTSPRQQEDLENWLLKKMRKIQPIWRTYPNMLACEWLFISIHYGYHVVTHDAMHSEVTILFDHAVESHLAAVIRVQDNWLQLGRIRTGDALLSSIVALLLWVGNTIDTTILSDHRQKYQMVSQVLSVSILARCVSTQKNSKNFPSGPHGVMSAMHLSVSVAVNFWSKWWALFHKIRPNSSFMYNCQYRIGS